MDFPRTPSPPPPPPPTPPEVLEPIDLSSERGVGGPDPGQDLGDQDQYNDGGQNPPRQNQVGTVLLRGVHIVSLYIDGERLCLAQISNTLLKNFSYNEIHNRRVALGITCVQCTPVQLEILRRAGAMPISSRRCGMITKREAERLVKSFLEEHAPPKLPDNFAFKVVHSCGWGCKGSFIPSRYNSSRAKCIKCTYCNLFFSPNKFIFHYHRMPDSKYRHPDAANFNSWRRHLDLDYDPNTDDLIHAWEDVKAMFNGGSRKRLLSPSDHSPPHESEKRPRMSLDTPSMPKLNHNRSCSVFPQVNGVPNLFPQQPPYGNFPMMHNDMDNMNPDRRVCVPDIWRPKNAMPYYNPLGLMWAKNFGFCPPAANMKPDVMREAGLRMPNVFMDMNGNKPSLDPHRTRPMVCKTNKSRNSAFRPVGNFQTPFPGVEGEGLGQPLTAPSSDHSDDFSEPAEDEEDEDIDVEGAREEDTTYDSSLPLTHDLGPQAAASSPTDSPTRYLQHSPPQYHSPSPGQLATSPPQYSTSPVHKDALPAPKSEQHSFTIDRLFDTKPDTITTKPATDLLTSLSDSLLTSRPKDELNGGESGQLAVTMTTGQPAPYGDGTTVTASQQSCGDDQTEAERTPTDTSKDLGYILELSKEQLQSELLKMLGVNKLKGDVDPHAGVALMAAQQSIQRDTAPQT